MTAPNFKRTKLACYTAYFTMSSVFSLPPLLFASLQDIYGISYTLLGTLVLTNFCTQLIVDLIFTAFSKHFNVKKVVRIMPLITSAGLLIYALSPVIFANNVYIGLLIGTILFSVSAGLSEVLLSPVIAAIPSDNPQKDMSLLHSLYAFGVFTVVVISTLFLRFFGKENWMYLTVFWAVLPVLAAVLFMLSPMPDMDVSSSSEGTKGTKRRTLALAICVGAIFFGSCAENSMSSWVSTFMENALHIDKTLGDILGMAMFAILLGIARISYAKFGKNIMRVLLGGMLCAAVCYITVGLTSNVVIAFFACILTGLFTAMLWPGTLIMMEENLPGLGVAAYALMASSGDLGASIAPQLLGIVVDKVAASQAALELGAKLSLEPEQIGLKAGMLVTAIFPILGTVLLIFAIKYFKKFKSESVLKD
ncbi:MAG: MFS transporter [Clostridia bacterium]|nr:MFS transporter [Clostridia bacterium]